MWGSNRAAETMRGARGKTFEWGLMTSPREMIHVILPQTLKYIQLFKHRSLYNLYTCFTSSFWGPFIGWGPGQISPPPALPLSAGLGSNRKTLKCQYETKFHPTFIALQERAKMTV